MVRRRQALAAAATAGAILCVVLLVALAKSGGVAPSAREQSVRPTVRADLQPRTHRFGETVKATLELVVSSEKLEPTSISATGGRGSGLRRGDSGPVGAFDPYEIVDTPTRTVERIGGLTVVLYTLRVRCLSAECLPDGESKEFAFPAPGFIWSTEAPPGRRFADRLLDERRAGGSWPALTVVAGVADEEIEGSGWRSALATLPTPSARISPRRLEAGLLSGAGALVLAAAALLGTVARRELRRREDALVTVDTAPPPLEQALRLVETADGHGDRSRIALETLASELRRADRFALADDAQRLAWAERVPQSEAVAELAASVRATVDGSTA